MSNIKSDYKGIIGQDYTFYYCPYIPFSKPPTAEQLLKEEVIAFLRTCYDVEPVYV